MVSWVACYKNGTTVPQGKDGGYEKLDRDNLEAFVLLFEDKPIFTIWLDEDRGLIWRLRRELIPGGGEIRTHLAGWRQNISGKVIQSLAFIYEQYSPKTKKEIFPVIHLAGKFDRQRNRFMNDPKFRAFEVFKGETYWVQKKLHRSRVVDGKTEEWDDYVSEPRIKE